MKYVVTAINRLTGEREAISRPHEKFRAETMKRRYTQRYVDIHDRPYIRLRVEPAVREGALWPEADVASLQRVSFAGRIEASIFARGDRFRRQAPCPLPPQKKASDGKYKL